MNKLVGLLRLIKFAFVGVMITATDYILYSAIMVFLFRSDIAMIGCATVMSGTVSTFTAFVLHSHVTWKEKDPGKYGIVKFFAWNIITVSVFRPVLTSLFESFSCVFNFVYDILAGMGIDVSYEFVMSTIVYVLMIAVITILNYIVYSKLVFSKERKVLKAIQKRRAKTAAKRATKKAIKEMPNELKPVTSNRAKKQSGKQVNVKRVRKSGEKVKRKRVSKKKTGKQ